jgi:tetratricopeptide (TPR) repeat protein
MLNKIISPDRQKFIIYIVLTVVTVAVFWQVNQYDFINLDDPGYVTNSSHIQSGITLDGLRWAFSTRYGDLWNPLVWLSLMFDYQLHGLNAGGYHLTNLILHVMSALLLFWLFSRMTGTIWKSAFVAALFALHPLHVESVVWIAERKDVLSAFFWMLTLCLYVYYTEKPVIRRYLLVLLCFACALMSKPMVITLPIVMILLDYWPLNRLHSRKIVTNMPEILSVSTNQGKKKNKFKKEALNKNTSPSRVQKLSEPRIGGIIPLWQLWEKIPFFVLSAVMIIITLYTPNTTDMSDLSNLKVFPLSSRLANAPVAFVTYLGKTFWPHDMAIIYPFSEQIPLWQVTGASLLILVISIAVIVMMKRLPYLFAGWLWFSIVIAPVIGIIQISISAPYAMADRYHYLPSIGLAVMMAWWIPVLIKSEKIRKKVLFPAGIIFLAVLSFISWNQCGYWKNSITLFDHTLQVTDDNWLAYDSRGVAYNDLGNYKQAIEDYGRAIEIKPGYAEAYNNRGTAYADLGNYSQAIENYDRAIKIKPGYAEAYNNRGTAYNGLGNYKQAIEDLNRAIKIKPGYASAYNNRGNVYGRLDNYRQAIEDCDRAIEIKPDYLKAYYNRALAYLNQGDNISGCRDAQKACILGNCKILEKAKSKGYCR